MADRKLVETVVIPSAFSEEKDRAPPGACAENFAAGGAGQEGATAEASALSRGNCKEFPVQA